MKPDRKQNFFTRNVLAAIVSATILCHVFLNHSNIEAGADVLAVSSIFIAAIIFANRQHKRQLSMVGLADTLDQLIFLEDLKDASGTFYNAQWRRYFNNELASDANFWQKYIHPDDLPACFTERAMGLSQQCAFTSCYRLKRNDGIYLWFQGRSVPITSPGGKLIKWLHSFTEINEQKNAEGDRERLIQELEQKTSVIEAVLENLPSGVILATEQKEILLKNQKLPNFMKPGLTMSLVQKNFFIPKTVGSTQWTNYLSYLPFEPAKAFTKK